MTWAKISLYILGLLKWFTDRITLKDAEELGQHRAEKKGDENVQDIVDTFDRVDAGRVPKPPD